MVVEREAVIDNTVSAIQNIVGGWIEATVHHELPEGVVMLVDEEGLLKGKRPNIWNGTQWLVGTIVFTAVDHAGDFRSLSDEEIEGVQEFIWG